VVFLLIVPGAVNYIHNYLFGAEAEEMRHILANLPTKGKKAREHVCGKKNHSGNCSFFQLRSLL
jgi:hypothetical protein